jgi:hypothetical protein
MSIKPTARERAIAICVLRETIENEKSYTRVDEGDPGLTRQDVDSGIISACLYVGHGVVEIALNAIEDTDTFYIRARVFISKQTRDSQCTIIKYRRKGRHSPNALQVHGTWRIDEAAVIEEMNRQSK